MIWGLIGRAASIVLPRSLQTIGTWGARFYGAKQAYNRYRNYRGARRNGMPYGFGRFRRFAGYGRRAYGYGRRAYSFYNRYRRPAYTAYRWARRSWRRW